MVKQRPTENDNNFNYLVVEGNILLPARLLADFPLEFRDVKSCSRRRPASATTSFCCQDMRGGTT